MVLQYSLIIQGMGLGVWTLGQTYLRTLYTTAWKYLPNAFTKAFVVADSQVNDVF